MASVSREEFITFLQRDQFVKKMRRKRRAEKEERAKEIDFTSFKVERAYAMKSFVHRGRQTR